MQDINPKGDAFRTLRGTNYSHLNNKANCSETIEIPITSKEKDALKRARFQPNLIH